MRYIPDVADRWQIIRAIQEVMHCTSFIEGLLVEYPQQEGLVNFDIHLPLDEDRGLRNKTYGSLYLPKAPIGQYFLQRVTTDLPVRFQRQKIKFSIKPGRFNDYTSKKISILEKTRFVDPDIKEKRETVTSKLKDDFLAIREVHIGVTYQEGTQRVFSSEFKMTTFGSLWIDYEHKLIRVEVCHPVLKVVRISRYNIARETCF